MSTYNVRWYSGRVLNERPVSIIIDDEKVNIVKIVSEEVREDSISRRRQRIFVVDTRKGRFNIACDLVGEKIKVTKTDAHSG